MSDEESDKLMKLLQSMHREILRLKRQAFFARVSHFVLKDLMISRLVADGTLPEAKAKEAFQKIFSTRYEAEILRIGDSDPELAETLDMHPQRQSEWEDSDPA
jgi:hypothetical protein